MEIDAKAADALDSERCVGNLLVLVQPPRMGRQGREHHFLDLDAVERCLVERLSAAVDPDHRRGTGNQQQISAVLGRATMQVSQLLKLGRGAVVELDRKLGEAVDIYVNNRLVARGEVVMVEDNRLGVTMTEIIKTDRAG